MPSVVLTSRLASRRPVRSAVDVAFRRPAGTASPSGAHTLVHIDSLAPEVRLDLLGVLHGARTQDALFLHHRPLLDDDLFLRHRYDDPSLPDLDVSGTGGRDRSSLDRDRFPTHGHTLRDVLGLDGLSHGNLACLHLPLPDRELFLRARDTRFVPARVALVEVTANGRPIAVLTLELRRPAATHTALDLLEPATPVLRVARGELAELVERPHVVVRTP